MKKYQLGALTVSDKGLQDTKEEIVIELIDRMQKYVAEGKAAYENREYTEEQKLNTITNLCGRFCGLAEFLQITMGIDVRRADGLLYTQEMFNHFHYWKMNLTADINRKGAIQYVYKKTDVRRLRIPRNADKRRNLPCRGTARVCGRADKTDFTVQRYGLSALRLSNRACGTFSPR